MNRVLTTLLIWLLIAVVPLNAVAATVGMSCGARHQQAMELVAPQVAGQSMHVAPGGGHHDLGKAAGAVHGHAMAFAEPDSGAADEPPHSSCSACSMFCVGAVAPPSVFVSIPSFSGSENVVIIAARPFTGFIPDGLRRPPRQVFT